MFKSLESIALAVGIFMYLTISKFKQVLRSRKGYGKVSTTTLKCMQIYCIHFNMKLSLKIEIMLIYTINNSTLKLHVTQ